MSEKKGKTLLFVLNKVVNFKAIFRAAGAFTNEREMHTTGKIYVQKRYIYSSCSTLIEDFKIQLSGIALKITG